MSSTGTASSWEDGAMRRESMEATREPRNRDAAPMPALGRGFRLRPLRLLRAIAIVIAIVLVLGELVARLAGFVDRVNPFPRRLYVTTDIPDLPYRLRPGVSLEVQG